MLNLFTRSFSTAAKKESLVILGTGWAGFKVLQDISPSKYDITVISPRNHFVFTPLLASTTVGTLEFRCVSEPIRSIQKNQKYYEAWAKNVDPATKTIECKSVLDDRTFTVPYDKLIVACGAVSNTFNTPGVQENAFFLKEVQHARMIRQRIIDCFEIASEPGISEEEQRAVLHFAVVGGGPTGIELSSEIHDFIFTDMSKLYPHLKTLPKLTVYDVADRILGSFDAKLAEYTTKKFHRDGTEIKTNTKIKEIQKDRLILGDGSEVRIGLVVWATGMGPNELTKTLPFAKQSGKQILTNNYLQVLKENKEVVSDVYAIGDCATIEDYGLPQTAQVAQQKARYLAKVLNRDKVPSPFSYRHKGMMAYVGDWKALVDAPHQYKGSGRFAFLAWRSSYLTMTVSYKNKILIPGYWFLTWLFGRDTSRF